MKSWIVVAVLLLYSVLHVFALDPGVVCQSNTGVCKDEGDYCEKSWGQEDCLDKEICCGPKPGLQKRKKSVKKMASGAISCRYGNTWYQDGQVVASFPVSCLQLVCVMGNIEPVSSGKECVRNCCLYDDQLYKPGSERFENCSLLVCEDGKWISGNGDPDPTCVDECSEGSHLCHTKAVCKNTVGNYICNCTEGYEGDGFNCIDVDECSEGSHLCHTKAVCTNTVGNYSCNCTEGYEGDGFNCIVRVLNCDLGLLKYGNSCYFFSSDVTTWANAQVNCNTMGGNLVTINNDDEFNFLIDHNTGGNTYIGLNDILVEGQYKWIGTGGSLLNNSPWWSLGEPDNLGGIEDCVYIREDDRFNDIRCSYNMKYICEMTYNI